MITADYHIHTTFSDGKNTPEEMVQRAIELGFKEIGFSDHSYTFFDESYCMPKEKIDEYIKAITDLKEKYSDKIKIYLGLEQDFYSLEKTDRYEYLIGSVHYVKMGDEYLPIDCSAEKFNYAVSTYFSGEPISFAEEYFKTVAKVIEKTNADIIGHIDLITKYNDQKLFDEKDPRYIAAWKSAVDELLKYNKPFEINMGAISRGYKTLPYPSIDIVNYIKSKGGRLVLSSDAHSTCGIALQFDKWEYLTK